MRRGPNPLFAKDAQLGALAEKKALSVLRKAGLRPRLASEPGYDIFLESTQQKVEVKFDVVMDASGNLGAELWSDRFARKPGWLLYSDADILLDFHDMDNAYVIDMKKMADWIANELAKNPDRFEQRPSKYSNAMMVLLPCAQIPLSVRFQELEALFHVEYDITEEELVAIRELIPKTRRDAGRVSEAFSKPP